MTMKVASNMSETRSETGITGEPEPEITWTSAKWVSITTGAIVGGSCFANLIVPTLSMAQLVGTLFCAVMGLVVASGMLPLAAIMSACTAAVQNTSLLTWCKTVLFYVSYALPVYLAAEAIRLEGRPSVLNVISAFVLTFTNVGLCMSVCLHRYFAHQAFKTSRGLQAVLAIIGCHAYQGCPIWWASKHRRHHKHCDTPEDPHSWKQTNYLYAWIGWTFNPIEHATDEEYVTKLRQFPELSFIGFFWWLWPLLTCALVYRSVGLYSMVVHASTPMLLSRVVTLLFNVEYHPPEGVETKLSVNGKGGCTALDMPRLLADCVGESCHDDHHTHPKRAKRPSGGFPHADLPYWAMIYPMRRLGLVWSVCDRSVAKPHQR